MCGFQGMYLIYSSIAQSVEHAAVNRAVVGSSPTRGVRLDRSQGNPLQAHDLQRVASFPEGAIEGRDRNEARSSGPEGRGRASNNTRGDSAAGSRPKARNE